MRAGCIDIGSNTTRLLIAERIDGRLVQLHQERVFTRIGACLTGGGSIPREKIEEVVAAVSGQLRSAGDLGVFEVRGVATAAIRVAANGDHLVAAIRRATGLAVDVLSGEDEARLAFLGAAAMIVQPPLGPLGVLDVGGGSSEMVVGTAPAQISWWASVPLGSGTLTDGWLHGDPPTASELQSVRRIIAGALADLEPPRPELTVAVGGSATSLCRLAGWVLDAAALIRALGMLTSEPSAGIAGRFQIDPQRARLLPAGLLILEAMADRLGAAIVVGEGGIREGVVLEALSA